MVYFAQRNLWNQCGQIPESSQCQKKKERCSRRVGMPACIPPNPNLCDCSPEQFRKPWLFMVYRGFYHQVMWGLWETNTRIPVKQPDNGKWQGFSSWRTEHLRIDFPKVNVGRSSIDSEHLSLIRNFSRNPPFLTISGTHTIPLL